MTSKSASKQASNHPQSLAFTSFNVKNTSICILHLSSFSLLFRVILCNDVGKFYFRIHSPKTLDRICMFLLSATGLHSIT